MTLDTDFLEKSILFTSIRNNRVYVSIDEHLNLEYFNNNDVKKIFNIIKSYFSENKKVPTLTEIKLHLNTKDLKESFKRIVLEYRDFEPLDEIYFLKQAEDFFKDRSVYLNMLDIAKKFSNREISNQEILEKFQYSCNISLFTDIGHDYFKDIDEHINFLLSDQERISTGFGWLDKKLGGGVIKSGRSLYLVVGGTNSGKSIWLGNLALNAVKQDLSVVLVTLEMSEQVYAQRISAGFSKIEVDQLKANTERLKQHAEEFKRQNSNANLIIKEFSPGSLSVAQLDNYLDNLKKNGYRVDILFVDYLTLMKSEKDGLYEKGKDVAEGVRGITYKHKMPCWSAIQANRDGTDNKKPQLNNAGESMAIMHTADFAFSTWSEEDDIETNTKRAGIIKNRLGENFGEKMFEFNTSFLTLSEQDEIFKGEDAVLESSKIELDILNEFR